MCVGQSNTAIFAGDCQRRKDCYSSFELPYVRLLPWPTALRPVLFVSGCSTGRLMNARLSLGANFNVITRPKDVDENIYRAQACGSTTAFLSNAPRRHWYIIDSLLLFEYLYNGFEVDITALNVCLIILQDTSELHMCLRLVPQYPPNMPKYTPSTQFSDCWSNLLPPELHLLFSGQGVFGFRWNCRATGAGGTA